MILLLILYERVVEKVSWDKLRGLVVYGLIGFAYSAVCVPAQHYFVPYGALQWTYIGEPPFAHLTADFVIERIKGLVGYRLDLLLAVAVTTVLAYVARRPQWLLGYVGFVPWTALNLLAVLNPPGR